MKEIPNEQLKLAREFVESTGHNIFLTGKAGTGKTTFLHNLKNSCIKRMVVVAPTGVAAINAGGVTIHSFFQLPFGPYLPGFIRERKEDDPEYHRQKFSRDKIRIMRSLDLLIIDEISMVRADLLDGIDETLRRIRNRAQPFGGVQLLMIGDMQQLAPVVKDEEWSLLRNHYDTAFFFSSKALQSTPFVTIELKHVYRQTDENFIQLLNKVRSNKLDDDSLNKLNARYLTDFNPGEDGYIILTTHNAKAANINDGKLAALKTPAQTFLAEVNGNYPEYNFPTLPELSLKVGAQVMFVKNDPDPEKLFFNGKIGKVVDMEEDTVMVQCPEDEDPIEVHPLEWQNIRYTLNEQTREITETVEGTFTQIPLKLAWAITVHKSQGLTFDRAVIDVEAAFAFGQVYVALSRCRTLEGMVLSSRIQRGAIKTDMTINRFTQSIEENPPAREHLWEAQKQFRKELLMELFEFQHFLMPYRYLNKTIRENAKSLKMTNIPDIKGFIDHLENDTIKVAEKFRHQLLSILQEEKDTQPGEFLQERIRKASLYFTSEIDKNILAPVSDISFESDNKQVKKKVREAMEKLLYEANYKTICLKACEKGFHMSNYINIRAKATLDEVSLRTRRSRKTAPEGGKINHELFGILKRWRDLKAEELGLPVYMILQVQSIQDISQVIPRNEKELKEIRGFGKKKLESFG
ncbi:MAG: AAA family ATPase, partial [Bacteroidetes bacterium]|nr:AAA family ATPase [Bacteroidota bacterium]